jgi:cyclophilin family peptidyl-prolyl cis-trans isomerase
MRKNLVLTASAIAALALFGAGCDKGPDPYVPPNPTPAGPPPEETPAPTPTAPNPTNSTSTTSASSTSMESTQLAFPGIRPAAEVNKKVTIKTTLGDIVIQVDPAAGPRAASNFVYLVGKKFYDGTIFHRVIPGFMIQGGDPKGTGTGGPGYEFDNDPVSNLPTKTITIQGTTMTAPVYEKGIVAMANAGMDTNGSQFFIMVGDYPLPPNYSIFGKVIKGQDIADKISLVDRTAPGQLDRPVTEVKMLSVTLE